MDETSARFINGLRQYDLTPKQIRDGGWKYCGGDKEGRHLNYFNMVCPDDEIPEKAPHCVCGHKIKENCYITNGDEILILGNECIKRFLGNEKGGRTCELCGASHRNRKRNRCNYCKKLI